MDARKRNGARKSKRFFKLRCGFPGKTHNYVRRDRAFRHGRAETLYAIQILLRRIAALHAFKHARAPALQGKVKLPANFRVF